MDIGISTMTGRPEYSPKMKPPIETAMTCYGYHKLPCLLTGKQTATVKYNKSKVRGPFGHRPDKGGLGNHPEMVPAC